MGTGMGLTLVTAGAPEPGEQSQAVCRHGRPCLLKTSPQGSEARLHCWSTDSHQMEPLPACGHPGAFRLAWEASAGERSHLLASASSAPTERQESLLSPEPLEGELGCSLAGDLGWVG